MCQACRDAGVSAERNRSLAVASQQTTQDQRDRYRAATVRERLSKRLAPGPGTDEAIKPREPSALSLNLTSGLDGAPH